MGGRGVGEVKHTATRRLWQGERERERGREGERDGETPIESERESKRERERERDYLKYTEKDRQRKRRDCENEAAEWVREERKRAKRDPCGSSTGSACAGCYSRKPLRLSTAVERM